jgi:hypothetical protein
MEKRQTSYAALILAAILLLLPVLFVGSYLALVVPGVVRFSANRSTVIYEPYRYGGTWAVRFYWPLEQIDRKLRPEAWERGREWDVSPSPAQNF